MRQPSFLLAFLILSLSSGQSGRAILLSLLSVFARSFYCADRCSVSRADQDTKEVSCTSDSNTARIARSKSYTPGAAACNLVHLIRIQIPDMVCCLRHIFLIKFFQILIHGNVSLHCFLYEPFRSL